MPSFRLFAASCALVAALNTGAFAASFSDQIKAAIDAGDFIAVEAIVAANPAVNDQATEALLRYVKDNLAAKPMKAVLAAEAMDVALQLGPKVVAAGAKPVADLVKEISEQASIGCTALTSKTTSDAGKAASGKALEAVQNGAEALAQLPVLIAANPQLVSDVKGENAKCRGGELQLSQTPFAPSLLRGLPPGQPPAGDLPSAE